MGRHPAKELPKLGSRILQTITDVTGGIELDYSQDLVQGQYMVVQHRMVAAAQDSRQKVSQKARAAACAALTERRSNIRESRTDRQAQHMATLDASQKALQLRASRRLESRGTVASDSRALRQAREAESRGAASMRSSLRLTSRRDRMETDRQERQDETDQRKQNRTNMLRYEKEFAAVWAHRTAHITAPSVNGIFTTAATAGSAGGSEGSLAIKRENVMMRNPFSMARREALRCDPEVVTAIRRFWDLYPKDIQNTPDLVHKDEFIVAHARILHHLHPPPAQDLRQCILEAEQAWATHVQGGRPDTGASRPASRQRAPVAAEPEEMYADYHAHFEIVFTLADRYCPSVESSEYVSFLSMLEMKATSVKATKCKTTTPLGHKAALMPDWLQPPKTAIVPVNSHAMSARVQRLRDSLWH